MTTIEDAQRRAISSPVKTFFCPSRRGSSVLPVTGSWYGPSGNYSHAPTDYACASAGSGDSGAIPYDNAWAMTAITDGTSNTLMIGDKRLNIRFIGQYQSDDNEGYTCGWDHDTVRFTDRAPLADLNATSGDGNQRFGSSHTGAFQAVFVDGSVRGIQYGIDLTTFYRLGHRNDGEVVAGY